MASESGELDEKALAAAEKSLRNLAELWASETAGEPEDEYQAYSGDILVVVNAVAALRAQLAARERERDQLRSEFDAWIDTTKEQRWSDAINEAAAERLKVAILERDLAAREMAYADLAPVAIEQRERADRLERELTAEREKQQQTERELAEERKERNRIARENANRIDRNVDYAKISRAEYLEDVQYAVDEMTDRQDGESTDEAVKRVVDSLAAERERSRVMRERLQAATELLSDCFWQWAAFVNPRGCVSAGALSTAEDVFAFFGVPEGETKTAAQAIIRAALDAAQPQGVTAICERCGDTISGIGTPPRFCSPECEEAAQPQKGEKS